jgi:GrpB-like predicted nucleotidyltransferase (UPF0157 family)
MASVPRVRNRRRNDGQARDRYTRLKSSLANQYANDRRGYTAAKAMLIAELLDA